MILVLVFTVFSAAYNNGVGQAPVMGWNTWCTDDACGALDICTEKEVKSIANSIISQGLDKLGYKYINLDDCWSDHNRTADGQLQPNPIQFPSGMKSLADYLHSLGLKLGLYTCVGEYTCKHKRPGSAGYFTQDAQTLAGWGVDFVKADNCHVPSGASSHDLYNQYSAALNATGRPMLFSLCNWGNDDVISWGGDVGQQFRFQMDHIPFWRFPPDAAGEGYGQGTSEIIEYMATLHPSNITKSYGFMDPDFLETLFPAKAPVHTMSFVDSKTEYSFWSLWSAPLIVATDIREMDSNMSYIIANPEVIAIDQDILYTSGERVVNETNGAQIWFKPLYNKDKAVILYNSDDVRTLTITVTWDQLGWPLTSYVAVRDLWNRADMGVFKSKYTAQVGPHDVFFFRATLQ